MPFSTIQMNLQLKQDMNMMPSSTIQLNLQLKQNMNMMPSSTIQLNLQLKQDMNIMPFFTIQLNLQPKQDIAMPLSTMHSNLQQNQDIELRNDAILVVQAVMLLYMVVLISVQQFSFTNLIKMLLNIAYWPISPTIVIGP